MYVCVCVCVCVYVCGCYTDRGNGQVCVVVWQNESQVLWGIFGWEEEMSLRILEQAGASALSLTPTQLSAAAGSVTADCDILPAPH